MPQSSAHAPSGVVSTLQGRANIVRAGQEAPQALKVGDSIAAGDVILAAADTRIEVSNGAGPAWLPHDLTVAAADAPARAPAGAGAMGRTSVAAKAAATQDLDDVLGAVNRGDADAATAAGLTGGGGASLSGGLRVDRVIEVVTPQAFSESAAREGVSGLVQTTAPQASAGAADVPTAPAVPATPANVAPNVGNYSQVTNEDQSVSGQVQGSDTNGDSLNYSKASDPQHGKVVVNADGSYTYTPNANYNGGDSFTVLVSDGKGGTALSTVNIEVSPVNDKPTVEDPSGNIDPVTGHYKATTDEDKPVSGKVSASDVDGDNLTFAKGSNPTNGTVTVDD
ncbi:MAG: cadherin-like domain-containing protein, partial [Pseudomonadota bacterium]